MRRSGHSNRKARRGQAKQYKFARASVPSVPRSMFIRSHGGKTTFDAGFLVPFFIDEILPGDTSKMSAHIFARIATLLKPVMENIYLETFFFFVPNRLVWTDWKHFMGEKKSLNDNTEYRVPQINSPSGGWAEESLGDYFGVPTKNEQYSCNALPFRAYQLIWNEWFRAEFLQDPIVIPDGPGPDDGANFQLLKRNKRHDYFTAGNPFPQAGPPVDVPLGAWAPVEAQTGQTVQRISNTEPEFTNDNGNIFKLYAQTGNNQAQWSPNPTASGLVEWSNPRLQIPAGATTLRADLSQASAITISALRQAIGLQHLLETESRAGQRYVEIIQGHFGGVRPPDYRVQRPEYLGGGRQMLSVHQVPNTAPVAGAQADLAAFGTSTGRPHTFNYSATEHGWIIGLLNVRADLNYWQGSPREFNRREKYDYYWPGLARLSEQEVYRGEIFYPNPPTGTEFTEAFSYTERYNEYRYKPGRITGKFRSNAAGSLDVWHLAQNFGNTPVLGPDFIAEAPPIDRIIAVQSESQFLADFAFDYVQARCMPITGMPGLRRL